MKLKFKNQKFQTNAKRMKPQPPPLQRWGGYFKLIANIICFKFGSLDLKQYLCRQIW